MLSNRETINFLVNESKIIEQIKKKINKLSEQDLFRAREYLRNKGYKLIVIKSKKGAGDD